MKKIHNIKSLFLWIAVPMMWSACEDVLEQTPSDKVSINRIINKSTIVNFRENAYSAIPQTFVEYSSGFMQECYSDDAFRAGKDHVPYMWHNGELSLTKTFYGSTIWNNCWKGIRRCNLALKYLPQSKVPENIVSADNILRYIDEVTLLRAWYHFMLIQNFGPLPFVEVAHAPSFNGWHEIKRPATYNEIAMRIAEECDKVIKKDKLALRWDIGTENAYVNKAFAYALKSRVLLYNASLLNNPNADPALWHLAAEAAQECLEHIVPEYKLLMMSHYADLFRGSYSVTNDEIIFRSKTNNEASTNAHNGIDLYLYGAADRSKNCGAVPSQELVDCFELKDGTLPIASYNNAGHTAVSFNLGYSESEGENPYLNRDARFYHAILFNGAYYGKMKNSIDSVIVYTYEGHAGSGFNDKVLSQEENDKRRSCTGYYTRKYRSADYWGTTSGGTQAHRIFFRLAEVYLNLAEAQCELDNLDAAMKALNVVRERALQAKIELVPGFVKSKAYLMQRIRNERRVELCFEGHRYYDQRRWKIIDAGNGAISGMKITANGGDESSFSYQRVEIAVPRMATTNKYLELPIAFEEARRMTGLGQPEAWQ